MLLRKTRCSSTKLGSWTHFFGCPQGDPKTTPESIIDFFDLFRRRVVDVFWGVPATPNDPKKSAHHEHQRVGPRVSDAAGSLENAIFAVNTAVFMDITVFKPPQAANAWRPDLLMHMMRGWGRGECAHHRGFIFRRGSADAHQQHQRTLGGEGGVEGRGRARLQRSLGSIATSCRTAPTPRGRAPKKAKVPAPARARVRPHALISEEQTGQGKREQFKPTVRPLQ